MTDPYQVLQVSRSASDDEIKKAYRELSRKYHPDSYVNNPLAELAEEKFKEVQEAYDAIMKERKNGGSSYTYTGSQGSYNTSYGTDLASAEAMVSSQRYQEAIQILSSISNRTSRWYYLSGVANYGIGNLMIALQHARTAVSMEPNNPEYISVLNRMQQNSRQYNTMGGNYGRSGMDAGDLCCNLCIADSCCECMGGDLIPCI